MSTFKIKAEDISALSMILLATGIFLFSKELDLKIQSLYWVCFFGYLRVSLWKNCQKKSKPPPSCSIWEEWGIFSSNIAIYTYTLSFNW